MKILLIFQKQRLDSQEDFFLNETIESFLRVGYEIQIHETGSGFGFNSLIKLIKKESPEALHFVCLNKRFFLEKLLLQWRGIKYTSSFAKKDQKNLPLSIQFTPLQEGRIDPEGFTFPIYATKAYLDKGQGIEEFCQLKLKGTKIIFGNGPLRQKYEERFGSSVLFMPMDQFQTMSHVISVFIYLQEKSKVPMYVVDALMHSIPVALKPQESINALIKNRFNGYMAKNLEIAALECLSLYKYDAFASIKSYILEDRFKVLARNCLG